MNEQSAIRNPQSAIDVSAIERELTSLWQQASEDDDGGIMRASTLNLLVFVTSQTDATRLDETLTDVTATHPSRAILIVAEGASQTPTLDAQVTSRCTLPTATSKQVCCEQVTINATGSQVAEVPSAVAPLLVSDLPVYLWWCTVPRITDKVTFRRLADLSDRVIIDSADFTDPHGDLASMAAVLRDTPRWTAISDLNWARLTAWRALLSGFYDISEYRPLLNMINHIAIENSPTAADPEALSPRALLLGGWLASRLGWRLGAASREAKSFVFRFEKDSRQVVLEFLRTEREIEPGRIAKVTIRSAVDASAAFSVRRSSDAHRLETVVTRGEERVAQRVLSYESLSESELIGRELEILGHDRVYEQAVIAAGEMVRALMSGQ
ncbi:MAG: glucose-6-phosphate dehydrogenase assembly protein OpcA [Blastocatellia bacterium]